MSIIDAAILIIIAGLAALGFLKGFFKSLVSFFSFIISLTLTILFVSALAKALFTIPAVGKWVADSNGSLFSWINKHLPASLDKVSVSDIREIYNKEGATGVKSYFKGLAAGDLLKDGSSFFGKFFIKICYPLVGSSLSNPVYLSSSIATARQLIALDLAYGIYIFIVGIVLFIALRIVAAIISLLLKDWQLKKTTLPGRALGAGLGAVKGFVYCVVILSVIAFMANFNFMAGVNKKIDQSLLTKPILKMSSGITSRVMRSGGKTKFTRLVIRAGFENDVYIAKFTKT